jgi:hypothetical protein
MHPALKSAAGGLTRVRHLEIDVQRDLESLCHYQGLRGLTVWLLGLSENGDIDTLPPLPDLRLLQIRFSATFSRRDTSASRHHLGLVDLSLLEGLTKLELRGTAESSLWSGSIVGSSYSIERLLVENVNFIDTEWRDFYPRLSCLRSLAMVNASTTWTGSIVLPLLESLEIESGMIPSYTHPLFTCPSLRKFTGTVHNPQAKLSHIFEELLSAFTNSIETFMLHSMGDGDVEILSPSAVQTFTHCTRLKNFLFDGRICITSPDWWVLRKVHNEVTRAIFLRPSYPLFKVEKEFYVRSPFRLAPTFTDSSRQLSEIIRYQTIIS